MHDAIKLYKIMRYLSKYSFVESIKSIYKEMNENFFYFYIDDNFSRNVLDASDYAYKWVEIKYKFYIIKNNNIDQIEMKLIKKWWSIYLMTQSDFRNEEWKKENIWMNDTTCDIQDIIEYCNIDIDRISYFQEL